MKLEPKNQIRVGLTKQSIKARLSGVRRGTGESGWQLVGHTELSSRIEAAAVEAIAHALLKEKQAHVEVPNPRGMARKMEVFKCKSDDAENAIEKAVNLLNTEKIINHKFVWKSFQ